MKKFWEQQEWLDKTKEDNVDFYKKVINGQNIEMDFSTFQLIIDGADCSFGVETVEPHRC